MDVIKIHNGKIQYVSPGDVLTISFDSKNITARYLGLENDLVKMYSLTKDYKFVDFKLSPKRIIKVEKPN